MQAITSCKSVSFARSASVAKTSRASARVVVCAQQQSPLAKAAAAGVSLPALLAAHPAFALVDDRLAGEGTGKIFGINDPALFWVLAGMFTLVWSAYYVAQRDVDGGENTDDSGLSL